MDTGFVLALEARIRGICYCPQADRNMIRAAEIRIG